LVCALLAAVFPWASGRVEQHLQRANTARFTWFYVHPISAATYTSIAALSVYTRTRFSAAVRGSGAWIRGGGLLLVLVTILALTRSRGPAIALVVAVGLLVLRGRTSHWPTAALCVGALIFAVVYLNVAGSFVDWLRTNSSHTVVRFFLRDQTPDDFAAFSGRNELWKGASALFGERPLLGYGYGGARGLLLDALPWAGDAHNGVMQSLLDVGVLGSLPLWGAIINALGGLITATRSDARRAHTRAAVLGYVSFFVLSSITDVGFTEPGYLFLVAAGCVVAAEHFRRGKQGAMVV
jgi:O-antigen ligase